MTAWLPLLSDPPPDAKIDVFAFPHAGASADIFRTLQRSLPSTLSLRPLELPGRGRRMLESPDWTLEPLVDEIADVIFEAVERPAVFFGHSMGALLAFETARALRGELDPVRLVLSGHRAPQLDRSYLRGHEDDDETFAAELRRWAGDDAAWLDSEELRALFLPVLRADFRALVAWRLTPAPPLDVPFTLLRGTRDPFLDAAGLEAWAEHSTRALETHAVEGDHFFWLQDPTPVVQALASRAP